MVMPEVWRFWAKSWNLFKSTHWLMHQKLWKILHKNWKGFDKKHYPRLSHLGHSPFLVLISLAMEWCFMPIFPCIYHFRFPATLSRFSLLWESLELIYRYCNKICFRNIGTCSAKLISFRWTNCFPSLSNNYLLRC